MTEDLESGVMATNNNDRSLKVFTKHHISLVDRFRFA
jgi:hypothetical protein